jgi:hypothetical protein
MENQAAICFFMLEQLKGKDIPDGLEFRYDREVSALPAMKKQ